MENVALGATPPERTEPPLLRRCIAVYLDVLGVRKAISTPGSHTALTRFLTALEEAHTFLLAPLESGTLAAHWETRSFTDNWMIICPVSDQERVDACQLSQGVGCFQLSLACNGFFVRGAIAVGEAYMDEKVVWGAAAAEAHDAETRAREARIILAPSAKELYDNETVVRAGGDYVPLHLRRDRDGEEFLDYLWYANLAKGRERRSWIDAHRESVTNGLRTYVDNPVIQQKYMWLATYHNVSCGEHADLRVDYGPGLEGPEAMY